MTTPILKKSTMQQLSGGRSVQGAEPVESSPTMVLFIRLFPTVFATMFAVFAILLRHPAVAAASMLVGVAISIYLTLWAPVSPCSPVNVFDEEPGAGWTKARGVNEFAAVALHRAAKRAPANDDSMGRTRKKKPTFFD